MNLFSSKKTIYLKILNIILLLWLIIATVMSYSAIINLIYPEPRLSYAEYEKKNCTISEGGAKDLEANYCEQQYEYYKKNLNDNKTYDLKNLFISLGNVVIVGFTLYLINKKKED